MSGPIAASYTIGDALLVAAIEAIRGAAEIAAGYAKERDRQADIAARHASEANERRQATLAARRALADEVAREESRLRRLTAARETLGEHNAGSDALSTPLPARPAEHDTGALAAYLDALRARAHAISDHVAALAQRSRTLSAEALATLTAATPTLADQLAAFEVQARLDNSLPPALAAERRLQAGRILARAALLDPSALPSELEALVAEFMRTSSAERAEALATELRLRIDQHNREAATEAAALVLEQSLRDLGYEVDGIGETLFVEGGVAHFRKEGWDDYFVRLRVDATRNTVNFNVVRSGAPGEDRKREDQRAEERWCAEFPHLQATLAARGLNLGVTRMLAAGEVPVQVVDAASLPKRAEQHEHAIRAGRLAMSRNTGK